MTASAGASRVARVPVVRRAPGALAAAVFAAQLLAQSQPPAPPALLITGARILDPVAGQYLPAAAVLVEKGRIRSVTATAPDPLPADTQTIAAAGKTIVPGLVDAHASAAPTADLDASYFAGMALAHGVTTTRALNLQTAWSVSQRTRVESGSALTPRLWVSGRGIDQGARPDFWLVDATSAAMASNETSRQVAAGVNWIAGYDHLPPDIYKAIVAATSGTSVRVSALPGASSMADLATTGVHSIETLGWPLAARKPGDDTAAADRAWTDAPARALAALATQLARSQITLVPLLASSMIQAFPDEVAKDPSLALLPEARRRTLLDRARAIPAADTRRARRAWTAQSAFLTRFVTAGGHIGVGTGFDLTGYPVPGAGVHTEMAALVRAGLKPADAIRAATTNAIGMLGIEGAAGSIAPGAEADFLIVDGDPLATIGDLSRITHVVRRGELLEPARLRDRARAGIK